jgi:Tat protein secretion system quality control protein TatD with DNase activity
MVADLKGMEPAEVAQKTTQNALELFGLDLAI